MFSFLKSSKPHIGSITVPHFGWNMTQNTKAMLQWMNQEQTAALSVNFFPLAPDLPSMQNIDPVRTYYRDSLAENGGLIQVDFIDLKGYPTLKTIFKIQQEETGLIYLASLIIPFETYSYVIKLQAVESGHTGMRETVVANKCFTSGKLTPDMNGWAADPYDPTVSQGVLKNLSEAEEHDAQFPQHPLSSCRKYLTAIESQIEFDPLLQKLKKFER